MVNSSTTAFSLNDVRADTCADCGTSLAGRKKFCGRCGTPVPGPYRPITNLELLGIVLAAPFLLFAVIGLCLFIPVIGWILIPFLILAMPIVPVTTFFQFRHAIRGPCPYCGANCNVRVKPFTCRACKRRVLVTSDAFVRVPD
jgi:predicted amidophosphoribosyltransferase